MTGEDAFGHDTTSASQLAALAFILAVGGWLRFTNLDTPSLWPDEMLVALMASFPIPYIAKWAMALEVHPPTYHYFCKLVEQVGLSDFALRLPSALAGTASLWLIWRAGRLFFGAGAGLFAAALLAGNPLHVWLSRQVRPYGLMVFFFLLAFIHLGMYLRTGERRELWKAMLANLPLVLLHYIALLILCSEGVLLVAATLPCLSKRRLKDLFLFAVGSLASFAPVVPFFTAMLAKRQDMTARAPLEVVFGRTLDFAQGLFNLFSHPALTWAMLGLWVAGLALLARRRDRLGWLAYCLAFMILPFAVILFQRYNTFYFSSHISFMLPAVVLPAGHALAVLVRRKRLAPPAAALVAATLAGLIMVHDHAKLYREDSTIIDWWRFGTFKTMARHLPERIRSNDQLVFADMLLPNSLNWYLRRFSAMNPVENPRLGPDDKFVVHFLSNGESVGNLFSSRADIARTGRVLEEWKLDALKVVSLEIPRSPVPTVDKLPFVFDVTGHPADFFSKVRSLEGLAVKPDWGGTLCPTRYRKPGWAEFELRNSLPGERQRVVLGLSFVNRGEGDEIALEHSFDEGPWTRTPVSLRPEGNGFFSLVVEPEAGWRILRWRALLTCAGRTPYGYGGSLQTVQLKSAHAWVCSAEAHGPCDQRLFEAQVRTAQESYRGVGFASAASSLDQEVILPRQGLKVLDEGEPGWAVLVPETPDKPVTVQVRTAARGEGAVFYPRTGGGSWVSVRAAAPTGQEPELFRLLGLEGGWTPMGAKYPLPLQPGKRSELVITLSGPWAQLWVRDKSVLFAP